MSYIGTNIRKIRGVKNLNQTAFAELFDLKRASVGAYEEGRAEPKIKTIIEIANHFGISIDDLLTKELSVNDLYKFDIFREDLLNHSRHNLNPSTPSVGLSQVSLISANLQNEYLKGNKEELINSLDSLYLPLPKEGNYMAFEIADHSSISESSGFIQSDILVGEKPMGFDISQLEPNKLYIFETSSEILIRKLSEAQKDHLILLPLNPNLYQQKVEKKTVNEVWQVKAIFSKNISNKASRLDELDAKIKALSDKLAN